MVSSSSLHSEHPAILPKSIKDTVSWEVPQTESGVDNLFSATKMVAWICIRLILNGKVVSPSIPLPTSEDTNKKLEEVKKVDMTKKVLLSHA